MAKKGQKKQQQQNFVRYNEGIRIPRVLVVHDGNNLGVMDTRDALRKARSMSLDLVEVAPQARPPVCQIMDYGKYQYEKNKRSKNKGHATKEKELSFRYVIDDHDLGTKANQARKFLDKGYKVKFVVKFKAREKAHKDKGFAALNKIIELLSDVAVVEKAPGFEGHNVTARLEKGNKDESSKPSKEAKSNPEKDS
jgi:translation initiation factor IF-3